MTLETMDPQIAEANQVKDLVERIKEGSLRGLDSVGVDPSTPVGVLGQAVLQINRTHSRRASIDHTSSGRVLIILH